MQIHTRKHVIEYERPLLTITHRKSGAALSMDTRESAWKDAAHTFKRMARQYGPVHTVARFRRAAKAVGLTTGPMYKPGQAPAQPTPERHPNLWLALRAIGLNEAEAKCVLYRDGCEASDHMGGRKATIRHAVRVLRRARCRHD